MQMTARALDGKIREYFGAGMNAGENR